VADEFNPNQITLKHWQKLAEECGVDERYLKKLLKEMALFLLENFELQRQLFSEKFGEHPALQRMQQVISKQCKGALKFL